VQQSRVSSIGRLVAASGLVLAVYAALLAYIPRDVFWHPDEGAKFIAMRTLSWDQGVKYSLPYPGVRLDPDYRFYGLRQDIFPRVMPDGTVKFRWPIVFPLLSRPFFDAFGVTGIYVLPLLSGWLIATLAGVWAYIIHPRAAPFAILLAGMATPVAFYSISFFEHTPATLMACLGLTALVLWPGRLQSLLLMTPFLIAAVVLRGEVVAFAIAAFLAWIITAIARRRWEPAALLRARVSTWATVLIVVGIGLVALIALQDVLPQRYGQYIGTIPHELGSMWFKSDYFFDAVVRILLGEPGFTSFTVLRVWQIAALMAIGGLLAAPFADTRAMEAVLLVPALFVLLQTALLTVISTLPFLQRQGVLAVAPFIGISLYALPMAWRRRDNRLLGLACAGFLYAVFGFLAVYSARVAEHDGSTLLGLDGAVRYMLTLYPIGAALAVLVWLDQRSATDALPLRTLFTVTVAALMLVSVYYEYLGLRELVQKRQVLVQWRERIRVQEPVVTDLWWMPAVMAPYSVEHEMYVIHYENGIDEWLKFAAAQGVTTFTLASTRPLEPMVASAGPLLRSQSSDTGLDLNVARFQRVGSGH